MNNNQNIDNNTVASNSTTLQNNQNTTANNSNEVKNQNKEQATGPNKQKKEQKTKPTLVIFLLIIIAGLFFFISYLYSNHQKEIANLKWQCTPVSTTKEIKNLDLDSTIVQDLYSKVKTSIREDIANPELNDEMKLYLAYRQMPTKKIYESNCNLFNDAKMEPYVCKETLEFTPTAFKEEDLALEVKKLFGETTNLQHNNIQLGATCLGGYQYIAERGEYVQGECPQIEATIFRADKKLVKATSQESTIVLYENVKYIGSVPETLISGTYKHTFRLDRNYNYVYISKEIEK